MDGGWHSSASAPSRVGRHEAVARRRQVWKGRLSAAATSFDGPVGTRTDNGEFDSKLRAPGGARSAATCGE